MQGETSTTMELVAPKFGSERVVYVPAELVTLFSEHVARTGGPGGWMFSRDGVPLNRNSAGHQWRQVRKDAGIERGMATAVGRFRECNVLDWKFAALSHNVLRGAAGAAVLNAEMMKSEGLIEG